MIMKVARRCSLSSRELAGLAEAVLGLERPMPSDDL